MTHEIADAVPPDCAGASEIGFAIPQTCNASRILFDNLGKGRGDRLALTGPLGQRSYRELCAEACRWGHGFASLGLARGDRILMFLDDTPAYPAAFFGAVMYTIATTREYPPDDLEAFRKMKAEKRGLAENAREILDAIAAMPQTMKQLAWVQIATWM